MSRARIDLRSRRSCSTVICGVFPSVRWYRSPRTEAAGLRPTACRITSRSKKPRRAERPARGRAAGKRHIARGAGAQVHDRYMPQIAARPGIVGHPISEALEYDPLAGSSKNRGILAVFRIVVCFRASYAPTSCNRDAAGHERLQGQNESFIKNVARAIGPIECHRPRPTATLDFTSLLRSFPTSAPNPLLIPLFLG
jgi:hypothetical protein